jgi:hypothetical protein
MKDECMTEEPIPYIPLVMSHGNLQAATDAPLPQGYSIRLFRPGEESVWAGIVTDAGEFDTAGEALAYFAEHFAGHYGKFIDRCYFLLDSSGNPVGTATGWFMDGDPSIGRLHWVAIAQAHQGRGLCKPLVAAAMRRMADLGHVKGMLTTQPSSWKGIKVYLGYGWEPFDDGTEGYKTGWAIIQQILGAFVP